MFCGGVRWSLVGSPFCGVGAPFSSRSLLGGAGGLRTSASPSSSLEASKFDITQSVTPSTGKADSPAIKKDGDIYSYRLTRCFTTHKFNLIV